MEFDREHPFSGLLCLPCTILGSGPALYHARFRACACLPVGRVDRGVTIRKYAQPLGQVL
jgi:hypothetical protein